MYGSAIYYLSQLRILAHCRDFEMKTQPELCEAFQGYIPLAVGIYGIFDNFKFSEGLSSENSKPTINLIFRVTVICYILVCFPP
jgi:hypothetical protein